VPAAGAARVEVNVEYRTMPGCEGSSVKAMDPWSIVAAASAAVHPARIVGALVFFSQFVQLLVPVR